MEVVHKDNKCANILVDASGSVKLADFGLAKATTLNDIESCKGTPYWMALEMQALFRIGRGQPPPIPDTLSIEAQYLYSNVSKSTQTAALLPPSYWTTRFL